MSTILEKKLRQLSENNEPVVFCGGKKGLEKESLRVNKEGSLSLKRHPSSLGSALKNKYITTDFSEALLEFVTPAYENSWEVISMLNDIHQFTYNNINDEILWIASIPCRLDGDKSIPIADYGSSNIGKMKSIYRSGLGLRYGRIMQAISGIHFNYSLPENFWPVYKKIENNNSAAEDFISSSYMDMIRNLKRFGWLILYLFGASPAICKSFLSDNNTSMPSLDKKTLFQPYGTSLRMSDLGYTSSVQSNINISLNNLDDYIEDLTTAMKTPEPSYQNFGFKKNGKYQQLSLNKLQIENEYYSTVRPKRVTNSGERPTSALKRGGIEYIEIRSLDVNVYDPVGINQDTMRFIESFMIFCLLEESPLIDEVENREIMKNYSDTSSHGRKPGFNLSRDGKTVSLKSWATEIIDGVLKIASLIDKGAQCSGYESSVKKQSRLVDDPDQTPSAKMLRELSERKMTFSDYILDLSKQNKEYFKGLMDLSSSKNALFEKEAKDSIKKQSDIESEEREPFSDHLKKYFES